MQATDSQTDEVVRESRIVPDPHRPGPGRVRLQPESIAVWAIVGQAKAIADRGDLREYGESVVRQLAHDYAISSESVRLALDWYVRQPCFIDAVLAENAAVIG